MSCSGGHFDSRSGSDTAGAAAPAGGRTPADNPGGLTGHTGNTTTTPARAGRAHLRSSVFENLTWTHLAIIAAVGLLVFGPDRLPGAIRWSAAALRQLRAQLADATSGLREEFGPELDELREPLAELQRLRGTTPRAAITRHLLNGDDTGAATFDHSPAALAVEPHHDDAGPPPPPITGER